MGRFLDREYSRRDAMLLGATGVAVFFGAGCNREQPRPLEWQQPISPRTLVIDTVSYGLFPTGYPDYGITIEAPHTEVERGREIFGEDYVPLKTVLKGQIGLSFMKPLATTVFERYKNKDPERALLAAAQVMYDNHGLGVLKGMEEVYKKNSFTRNVLLYPLQEVLDINFPRDTSGNLGITFISQMNKAADVINAHPERSLVNMSWQPGANTIWYKEYGEEGGRLASPYFKFEGGYTGNTLRQRLMAIAWLRRQCPNHFILSAASNLETDYLEELHELKQTGEMPSNGIFVGDYETIGSNDGPLENELGPDVYVRSQRFKVRRGSSNSTGMMTALLDSYMERGNSLEEALFNIFQNDSHSLLWNNHTLEVIDPGENQYIAHQNQYPEPIVFSPFAR